MQNDGHKAGVIGWPVSHSLSPALHNYWLKHYAMAGSYNAYAIKPEALVELRDFMETNGLCGVNVTVPHKESILPLMDTLDDGAEVIGAVNMVSWDGKKLHGANTDAYGFTQHITREAPDIATQKAVVLGAGGAARAIVHALKNMGFQEIMICNRTESKAIALAAKHQVHTVAWSERGAVLMQADLLVNTTVLGMKGAPPLEIDLSELPTAATVYDLIYRPLATELLQNAASRGNKVMDGLGMLMHQAVPCFEAWYGTRPDVTPALRDTLESLLV